MRRVRVVRELGVGEVFVWATLGALAAIMEIYRVSVVIYRIFWAFILYSNRRR